MEICLKGECLKRVRTLQQLLKGPSKFLEGLFDSLIFILNFPVKRKVCFPESIVYNVVSTLFRFVKIETTIGMILVQQKGKYNLLFVSVFKEFKEPFPLFTCIDSC